MSTVGLVGISSGVGEVIGGGIYIIGSKWESKIGRHYQLAVFLIVQVLSYVLVLLNLPNLSTLGATSSGECALPCIMSAPS